MYELIFKDTAKLIIESLLDGKKTLTQLSHELELTKPALQQKYLSNFERMGLIKKSLQKTKKGREAYFELLPFTIHISFDPEANSVISIVSRSRFGYRNILLEQIKDERFRNDMGFLMDEICTLSRPKRPDFIILYGSIAKEEGSDRSDIDIALIRKRWSKKDKESYIDLISNASINALHIMKPVFITQDDLIGGRNELIKEIRKTGKIVYGDFFKGKDIWRKMQTYRNITI